MHHRNPPLSTRARSKIGAKKPKLHVTDVVVSRLKFRGTYYDEMTPAFGLRVGKNRKAWFVVRGRERLRTNIGQYPATSFADAWKRARKLLTEEPTKADRITFNAAYDIYKEALKNKRADPIRLQAGLGEIFAAEAWHQETC